MATEAVDVVVGPFGAGVVAEAIGGEVVGVGVVAVEGGQEQEVEAHVVCAVLGGNNEAVGVLEGDRHVEVVLGMETGQPHHGGEVVNRLGVEVRHGVGGAEGLYDADKLETCKPWLVVGR